MARIGDPAPRIATTRFVPWAGTRGLIPVLTRLGVLAGKRVAPIDDGERLTADRLAGLPGTALSPATWSSRQGGRSAT